MNKRHLLMAVGLLVAAWLAIFGDKSPSSDIVKPVTRETKSSSTAPVVERKAQNNSSLSTKSTRTPDILVLQERESLIGGGHKPSRTGLFGSQNWTPPPPPPPKPGPPPPPMAPPIPFTYIGKKFDGSNWEVYIMRGEQTYVVREQTVLESTYRIDSIKPPTLTLTYLPLQQVQTLTIGGTD
jgi:hypothetical protein